MIDLCFLLTIDALLNRSYLEKTIQLQLNKGRKVQGTLLGYDQFMNVVLSNAVEEEKATGRANPIGMVVSIIVCLFVCVFYSGILIALFSSHRRFVEIVSCSWNLLVSQRGFSEPSDSPNQRLVCICKSIFIFTEESHPLVSFFAFTADGLNCDVQSDLQTHVVDSQDFVVRV